MLIDVCFFEEYIGKCIYMFDYFEEGVLWVGYIFMVVYILWGKVVDESGWFCSCEELEWFYDFINLDD